MKIYHKIKILLLISILYVVAGIFSAISLQADEQKALYRTLQSLPWLNVARPLNAGDLQGKIMLLDFWTYGCINCIHIIPDLEKLEKKYGDQLVVIGVHSPKFENEKNIDTLRNIVARYHLTHPVVNDIDFTLWKNFGVRAWPTVSLINPQGEFIKNFIGEGNYEQMDEAIEELVSQHRDEINDRPIPLALEKNKHSNAILASPGKIAVNEDYIAISDSSNHRIMITNHDGKVLHAIGSGKIGYRDGDFSSAQFNNPQGLIFLPNFIYFDEGDGFANAGEVLYVADTGNHRIRRINLRDNTVKTIAGNGESKFVIRGSHHPLSVPIRSPWALAVNKQYLYIAVAGNHQIWRLNLQTHQINVYAGSGYERLTDGKLLQSAFNQPSGLAAIDNQLYVADAEASAIRRINLNTERVSTLVGKGLFDFGDKDGKFDEAMLQHTLGVVAINNNELIIADTYNHRVKLMNLKNRTVTSIIGTGKPENSSQALNEPGGLAIYQNKLYIADTGNHRIIVYDLKSKDIQQLALQDN